MDAVYTINTLHADPSTEEVLLVDFTITFSDPAFPGETARHGGLAVPGIPVTSASSDVDLVDSLKESIKVQLPMIELSVLEHLKIQYLKSSLTKVEKVAPPFPALTPREIELALYDIGITDAQITAALSDNEKGLIEWRRATLFERDHPLIDSMGLHFGLTQEQIDTMWRWAKET